MDEEIRNAMPRKRKMEDSGEQKRGILFGTLLEFLLLEESIADALEVRNYLKDIAASLCVLACFPMLTRSVLGFLYS